MDKPNFPSDRPLLTDADDRRLPRPLWSDDDAAHYAAEAEAIRERRRRADIRAQVAEYEDIGDMPALPRDFTPHSSARMPLADDDLERVPVPWWTGWVLPVLLTVALLGAIASCAFGGGR